MKFNQISFKFYQKRQRSLLKAKPETKFIEHTKKKRQFTNYVECFDIISNFISLCAPSLSQNTLWEMHQMIFSLSCWWQQAAAPPKDITHGKKRRVEGIKSLQEFAKKDSSSLLLSYIFSLLSHFMPRKSDNVFVLKIKVFSCLQRKTE